MKVQIPSPAGYHDVMGLLSILANPEHYALKLAELEKLRREINERAECQESWARIQAMEAESKAARGEAARLLEDAKRSAGEIVTEAEQQAAQSVATAQAQQDEWVEARLRDEADFASRVAQCEERERLARLLREQAKADIASAYKASTEAAAVRAEYDSKVVALKGLVS